MVVWIDEIVSIKNEGNTDDTDSTDTHGFEVSESKLSFP